MPGTTFDAMKSQNNDLIRKALSGSLFLAPYEADPIAALTLWTAGSPGVLNLNLLPDDWDDAGYLTDDGVSHDNEVTTSDTTAWQSTAPVRSDVTADTDTITAVMEETKLLTIGLYTGATISTTLTANTGELSIAKPARPTTKYYRAMSLAVDGEGDSEFFLARFYPKVKVTSRNAQSFAKGDDPISWGVTLTSFVDDDLGYSMKWLFGGTGWKAAAVAMGFSVVA